MTGYIHQREDLKWIHDEIVSWAEFSFVIGGIAWHKQQDLENRIAKLIDPILQEKESSRKKDKDLIQILVNALGTCREARRHYIEQYFDGEIVEDALKKAKIAGYIPSEQ